MRACILNINPEKNTSLHAGSGDRSLLRRSGKHILQLRSVTDAAADDSRATQPGRVPDGKHHHGRVPDPSGGEQRRELTTAASYNIQYNIQYNITLLPSVNTLIARGMFCGAKYTHSHTCTPIIKHLITTTANKHPGKSHS